LAPEFTDAGPMSVMDASGGVALINGVTAFDGADSALLPTAFVACTVKV
jgi:hypothetical protein